MARAGPRVRSFETNPSAVFWLISAGTGGATEDRGRAW